jgi:plasmid stability protein
MGTITIQDVDDAVIAEIERRAAHKGLSVEEEITQLLVSIYRNDQQERGRQWARRQLARLKRGELPVAKVGAVEEIRAMRQERTEQLGCIPESGDEHRH